MHYITSSSLFAGRPIPALRVSHEAPSGSAPGVFLLGTTKPPCHALYHLEMLLCWQVPALDCVIPAYTP